MTTEIYTDGSSLKNPGASGLAYIIRYWVDKNETEMPEAKIIEGNQGFRLSTNNRMEIMAGILNVSIMILNSRTLLRLIFQVILNISAML